MLESRYSNKKDRPGLRATSGEDGAEEYHSGSGISTHYPMRARSELTFPLLAWKDKLSCDNLKNRGRRKMCAPHEKR